MKFLLAYILLISLLFVPAFSEESASPMLAADGSHMLALASNGDVWAWGSNHRGETDPSDESIRITEPKKVFENAALISAGQQFSMAVTADGALYMWGDNREGQIPRLEGEKAVSPTFVFENVVSIDACDAIAACVTKDGRLHFWGGGQEITSCLENVVKCAAGMNYALALTSGGQVYEITSGSDEPMLMAENASDIDASGESRYALLNDGTLCAWGASYTDGRLGINAGMRYVDTPETVAKDETISSLHAGLSFSGYIADGNALHLWGTMYSYIYGLNDEGTLEAALFNGTLLTYGNTPLRLYENVKDACMGDAFIALLFENGDVYTWGSNDHGQLGNGAYTLTVMTESEEDDEYELEILQSQDSVFPNIPITLK